MSNMSKGRLEAFSDGVLAIIITIMILELQTPHGVDVAALLPLLPAVLAYILSFIYVGIYWNNHHHLLQATERVNGKILWANLHLLFWLSLVPFTTGWMGENHFAEIPTVFYGFVLFMSSVAYWILQRTILKEHGRMSILGRALGRNLKGKVSMVLYGVAVVVTFVKPIIGQSIYALVAFMWFMPDQRIEKVLAGQA